MRSVPSRSAVALSALLFAGLLAASGDAVAGPLGKARWAASHENAIVLVGSRKGWKGHGHRYRFHRRVYGGSYVRAPFTRVRTRGSRWTSVDAPFASVRVRPWGTWVRAPFVDLYVPR